VVGLVVFLWWGVGPTATSRGEAASCPGGRFLVLSGPLVDPDTERELVVISEARVSIGSVCPPVLIKLRKGRRGRVRLRAAWPACAGVQGRARLKGSLEADCATMTGTFVVRRSRIRRGFSARLSACGDGVVDPENGEQCERLEDCAAAEECFDICACGPRGQRPTTTLPAVSFSGRLQPLFTTKCATSTCHGGPNPQQDLDLRAGQAHRELVNVDSTECPMKRVLPGAPDLSYLMFKLAGGGPCFLGTRMPPAATMSEKDREAIESWIAAGAPDN
jgi:hypothetical protein